MIPNSAECIRTSAAAVANTLDCRIQRPLTRGACHQRTHVAMLSRPQPPPPATACPDARPSRPLSPSPRHTPRLLPQRRPAYVNHPGGTPAARRRRAEPLSPTGGAPRRARPSTAASPAPRRPGGMQAAYVNALTRHGLPIWTKGQTRDTNKTQMEHPFHLPIRTKKMKKRLETQRTDGCRGRRDGGGCRVSTTPHPAKNTVCAGLPPGCPPHRGLGHGDASMLPSFYRSPPCTQWRVGARATPRCDGRRGAVVRRRATGQSHRRLVFRFRGFMFLGG